MPEIIATGGGSDKDLRQNPLKAAWEKFSTLDKFSKTMVTTTVLFLLFATAITTITLSIRQYAGGGGIARVEINPGIVTLNVGQKQALSTLAYDHNNNAVFSDVVYEWSTSSASSAATLSRTIGDITELTALRAGCSSLTVIARDGIATVTKSIIVAVSQSDKVQNCGVEIIPTGPEFTPTPTGSLSAAICLPKSQSAQIGQTVTLQARGGNGSGTYYWYSNGLPANSKEDVYHVSFNSKGNHPVALSASGYPTIYCNVSVVSNLTSTPTPTPIQSSILEINPIADTYVRSDYPNKNYGEGKALRIDGKPTVKGYLKFDLRKLAGRRITSAKLGFYVLDVKGSGSPGTQSLVRVANSNWTERSLTYRNAPDTVSVFSSHTNARRNTYVYYDITDWVRDNQGKLASMAVLNSSNNEAVFGSREQKRASERPTIIVYSEPDQTITPTPTFWLTPTSTPTTTPSPAPF